MSEEKLKTLKDLSSVSVHHTDLTKQKVIGVDNNNDLIFDNPPEMSTENLNFVSYELLREEAKKYIKHFEEVKTEDDMSYYAVRGILSFIKDFFNLEEEGTKKE